MSRSTRIAALTLLLASAACGDDSNAAGEQPSGVELAKSELTRQSAPRTDNVAALAEGNTAFAFELFRRVAADNAGKNVVLSPYSISTALAMTYAGARSQTEVEMKQTLHFDLEQTALHEAFNAVDLQLTSRGRGKPGADGTPFRLNVDNAIWVQRGFPLVPAYLDVLAVNYGAGVFLADFAREHERARMAINAWVEAKTEELIPELLPMGSVDSSTALVLTNTVYFNASWKTKFEEKSTQEQPFKKLDGSTVQVPTMNAGLQGVRYAKGELYQAVALPYASEELAFVAVLPDEGAYEQVESATSATWFAALATSLAPSSVQLSLPKLDYRTATSLAAALRALGMNAPFAGADFSGMTTQPVEIADVIHEAVIKVFEGGTIAAAATAVVIRTTSVPQFEHTVVFDRPFLYAIVDQPTGHVLFMGRVLDPAAK